MVSIQFIEKFMVYIFTGVLTFVWSLLDLSAGGCVVDLGHLGRDDVVGGGVLLVRVRHILALLGTQTRCLQQIIHIKVF